MAWNELFKTTPQNGNNPGYGAPEIRTLKQEIESEIGKEHRSVGTELADSADRFYHRAGSAKIYAQSTAPSVRPDGTSFTSEDVGRKWYDTTEGLEYILVSVDSGTPTWRVVDGVAVGDIVTCITVPSSKRRLLPCDGRQINNGDTSVDGEVGGYVNLITALRGASPEFVVDGNPNAAYVPDMRGTVPKGMNTIIVPSDQAVGGEITNRVQTESPWADEARDLGSRQEEQVKQHSHEVSGTLTLTDEFKKTLTATEIDAEGSITDSGADYDGRHQHNLYEDDAGFSTDAVEVQRASASPALFKTLDDDLSAHQHYVEIDHTHTVDLEASIEVDGESVMGTRNLVNNTSVYFYIKY